MSEIRRCEICDWPLAATRDDGCVPGNCSYRPREGSDELRRIQKRRRDLARQETKGPRDDRDD